MIICTAKPEADARLTHPPNALHDFAKLWGGAMDNTVLLPFRFWFALVFPAAAIREVERV